MPPRARRSKVAATGARAVRKISATKMTCFRVGQKSFWVPEHVHEATNRAVVALRATRATWTKALWWTESGRVVDAVLRSPSEKAAAPSTSVRAAGPSAAVSAPGGTFSRPSFARAEGDGEYRQVRAAWKILASMSGDLRLSLATRLRLLAVVASMASLWRKVRSTVPCAPVLLVLAAEFEGVEDWEGYFYEACLTRAGHDRHAFNAARAQVVHYFFSDSSQRLAATAVLGRE